MNKKADVAVVGGGPCGSFSAWTAARLGAEVVVCEEHGEIGVPSHCPGHVSISGLKRLGLSVPQRIIENKIRGVVFYSPHGREFLVKWASPMTCVLDRKSFDKYLAELALSAGAQYMLGSRVESFILSQGSVSGVSVKGEKLASDVVIDAEGCSSALLKRFGLQTLDRSMVVNAIQAEVDQVKDLNTDLVEVYLGRNYAPGFFAWIIPKRNGSAKVGLATIAGDPREYLRRFMHNHPVASKKLRESVTNSLSLHPIPLGGAIPKTYAKGLLVVGDAASQVKPTTGGGLIFGLLCSKVAGEVAYEAVKNNDFSENFLSRYQSRWRKLIGFDLAAMLQIRKMLNRLSDDKIDKLIDLCAKSGINHVLERFGDVDLEGGSLIRMIPHPATLRVAFSFFISVLTSL